MADPKKICRQFRAVRDTRGDESSGAAQRRNHAIHVGHGHMFSLFTKDAYLASRLPRDVQQAFLKKYKTKVTEQYGAVMKEYVDVPEALLKKTNELKKYFDLSFAYVSSLKPKPTSKNKATKKR